MIPVSVLLRCWKSFQKELSQIFFFLIKDFILFLCINKLHVKIFRAFNIYNFVLYICDLLKVQFLHRWSSKKFKQNLSKLFESKTKLKCNLKSTIGKRKEQLMSFPKTFYLFNILTSLPSWQGKSLTASERIACTRHMNPTIRACDPQTHPHSESTPTAHSVHPALPLISRSQPFKVRSESHPQILLEEKNTKTHNACVCTGNSKVMSNVGCSHHFRHTCQGVCKQNEHADHQNSVTLSYFGWC